MDSKMHRTVILDGEDMLALTRDFRAEGQRIVYRGNPHGMSMWPFIRTGDAIIVEQIEASVLQRGDVLVFLGPGGRLVAHRLRRIEDDGSGRRYVTRGDSCRRCDRPVTADTLIGRVTALERGSRRIALNTRRQQWLVRVWLRLHPLPALCLRAASRLRRRIQGGLANGL